MALTDEIQKVGGFRSSLTSVDASIEAAACFTISRFVSFSFFPSKLSVSEDCEAIQQAAA